MIRVKICGLTNEEDLFLCADAGAHALGFVVDYPVPVPWNLSLEQAKPLFKKLPPFCCGCAVTGGEPEKVLALAEALRPQSVQLQYQETPEDAAFLCRRLNPCGIQVIKAVAFPDGSGRSLEEFLSLCSGYCRAGVSALVLDSRHAGNAAEKSRPADLSLYRTLQSSLDRPVILAGGLTPENLGGIVKEAAPYAVDVLSGVEDFPGKKSPQKVRDFMRVAFCPSNSK